MTHPNPFLNDINTMRSWDKYLRKATGLDKLPKTFFEDLIQQRNIAATDYVMEQAAKRFRRSDDPLDDAGKAREGHPSLHVTDGHPSNDWNDAMYMSSV